MKPGNSPVLRMDDPRISYRLNNLYIGNQTSSSQVSSSDSLASGSKSRRPVGKVPLAFLNMMGKNNDSSLVRAMLVGLTVLDCTQFVGTCISNL